MSSKAIYNAGISEATDVTPTQAFLTQDTNGTTAPERLLYSVLLEAIEDDATAFAAAVHTHDDRYYTETEMGVILADYYTAAQVDAGFATIGHNHDSDYAALVHTHDDRYYTETEADALFATVGHTHTSFTDITVDTIQFDLTDGATLAEGQIGWNNDEKSLDVGGGNHVLQLGQETYFHLRNNSGVTIDNGDVVMFTGALGASGKITGAKAVTDGTYEGFTIMGVATESIANGADGMVTNFGKLRGIQTNGADVSETWVDGTLLYPDDTTPGALTNVEPTGPSMKQPIAAVVNAHVSDGIIFVRTPANTGIHELHDTDFTGAGTNDLITLNASGVWVDAATLADGNVAESNVTQHQAALSITESQISDLGTYLENVVEDTTPQLGGSLDTNLNPIISVDGVSGANQATDGATINITSGSGGDDSSFVDGGAGGIVYITAGDGGDNTGFSDGGAGGDIELLPGSGGDGAGSDGRDGYVVVRPAVGSSDGGSLRFYEAPVNGTNIVGIKAPDDITNTVTWTLPEGTSAAANGKFLTTDASGVMSWDTPAETNNLTAAVTWANVPDANITQSSVTQHEGAIDHDALTNFATNEHIDWTGDAGADNISSANITAVPEAVVTAHQAALSITESQISDLSHTVEVNDLSAAVTWANVPDANITESSVTQHEAALTITVDNYDTDLAEEHRIHDGLSHDKPVFSVVDATGLKLDVTALDAGDMKFHLDGTDSILDCTTGAGAGGAARVALTAGADANNPVTNHIYVTNSGGVATLTASTSLPTGSFAWVGKIVVPDATTWATTGEYGIQRYTEAYLNDSRGALSHQREKLRALGAVYISGGTHTLNLTVGDTVVHLDVASASVYQLHRQTFPNIATGPYYYGNGTTPYASVADLGQALTYSDGSSVSNQERYNLVIWGAINYSSGDCKLFVNMPSDGYLSDSAAISDGNATADYTVPADLRSVAFMIARVVLKYSSGGGTFTEVDTFSLLGQPPGVRGGGSGAVAATEFSDSSFRVYGNVDATKEIALEADGITTGTTRTITMPDADVDLGALALSTHTHELDELDATAITDGYILTADGAGNAVFEAPVSGVTDHTLLSNIGTNTHAQIDTHIADSTLHYTQASISITESQISDLQSYILAAGVTYGNLDANGDVGTGAGQLAIGNHTHTGVYEPADATILKDADLGVTVAQEAHVHEGTEIDATAITDGYVLTADGAGNSAWEAAAGGGGDVVDDTTPQLGGNLDVNGKSIVSVSNGDINLEPNGSGNVLITDAAIHIDNNTSMMQFQDTLNQSDSNDYWSLTSGNNWKLGFYDNSSVTWCYPLMMGHNAPNIAITEGYWNFMGYTAWNAWVERRLTGLNEKGILRVGPENTGYYCLSMDGDKIQAEYDSLANDLLLNPYGGDVALGNFDFDADQTVGAGQDNYVLTYDNAGGKISLEAAAGGGGASQLSDLSDVGVTTATNKNALMADGDSWESRALVEADISDLGSYSLSTHVHGDTGTVQTTDATPTTLDTYAIATNEEVILEIKVHGHEDATDDHIWKKMVLGVKNIGGTASLIGGVDSTLGYDAGASTWDITASVSSGNVVITVTGEASHTIDWRSTMETD